MKAELLLPALVETEDLPYGEHWEGQTFCYTCYKNVTVDQYVSAHGICLTCLKHDEELNKQYEKENNERLLTQRL